MQNIAKNEVTTINTDDKNEIEYGFARTVGLRNEFSINSIRSQATANGSSLPPQIFEETSQTRINEIVIANMALSGTVNEAIQDESGLQQV